MTRRLVAAALSLSLAGVAAATTVAALSPDAASEQAYQFCIGLTKKGGGNDNLCIDTEGGTSGLGR